MKTTYDILFSVEYITSFKMRSIAFVLGMYSFQNAAISETNILHFLSVFKSLVPQFRIYQNLISRSIYNSERRTKRSAHAVIDKVLEHPYQTTGY